MNQRGEFSKHVTSFLEFLPAWQCFFYFWNRPYPRVWETLFWFIKKKSQNITWNKYIHLYPWLCAPRKTIIGYNLIISSLDIQVLQHITFISNGKEHQKNVKKQHSFITSSHLTFKDLWSSVQHARQKMASPFYK